MKSESTFSLGIFFFEQPSHIIGYFGQISSWAWKQRKRSQQREKAAIPSVHRCFSRRLRAFRSTRIITVINEAVGGFITHVITIGTSGCRLFRRWERRLTLMLLSWKASLQYLQLRVRSGHSLSLWRSCSLALISSLQEGHKIIMKSQLSSCLACR